jgi:hypothetical protein
MFTWICPQCGREVPPSSESCPDCKAQKESEDTLAPNAALDALPVSAPDTAADEPLVHDESPRGGRIAGHLRLVTVFWLVQGVLHFLASLAPAVFLALLNILAANGPPIAINRMHATQWEGVGVLLLLGMVAWTIGCLIVALGLLNTSLWARTFAIVMSAIALLDFPVGTALGIYTLWVLLPEASEDEYRQRAMQ